MVLEVGKAAKAKFIRFVKKTNIFECGGNGVVLERENKQIYLYATNAACSKIYCTIPLGSDQRLKTYKFVVIAYNDHVMLVDGGDIRVVIDYDCHRVAVNSLAVEVIEKNWNEGVQVPWKNEYNRMFGA